MVVANGNARTVRLLTQADALGFGLSDVHFATGHSAVLWYTNTIGGRTTSLPAEDASRT